MAKSPYYDFTEFKNDCASLKNVAVWKNVISDASTLFNLNTKKDLLNFIANDGLENIKHLSTEPLKSSHCKIELPIDSYEFKTKDKIGYLAFFKGIDNKTWIIKSFHYHHKMKHKKLMDSDKVKMALKAVGLSKRKLKKIGGSHGTT